MQHFLSRIEADSTRRLHAAVRRHGAERNAKGFISRGPLVAMRFCQLGSVNSLRDITNGLAASEGKLRTWASPPLPGAPPWLCHRPSPQRAVRGSLLSDAGSRLQSGSTVWRPAQVPLQEQTVVDRGSISSTGTAVFAAIESDLQLTWTAESLDKGFSAPPQHLSEHILDGRQLHA